MAQVTAIINRIVMDENYNVSFYNQFGYVAQVLDTAVFIEISGDYLVCGGEGDSVRFFANTVTSIEGPTFSQSYTPITAGFYQQGSQYFERLTELYDFINTNIVSVVIRNITALKFADGTTQTTAATGGGGSGTVTSVGFTEGNGIDITGTNPITTSGTVTITNTAPDQVVTLGEGTGIDVTGTYPNFTITNTAPNQTVSIAEGTGIDVTGTYPNFTVTNTAPDKTVVLTEGTGIDITGTYPNFTIANSQDISNLVPYTGATKDVNLGVHSITMDDGVTDTEMSPSLFGVENHAQNQYSTVEYNQITVANNTIPSSMAITATGVTFPDYTTQTTAFTNPLTTKGDIYVRNSTANTRLPVGLDTQMLVADSSTTTGLKWTAQPAATPTGYYGAWQDNNTQSAPSSNVGVAMIFRTIDLSNGVSVVTNGTNLTRITFANTGIYNLQFSSQFQNSNNSDEDVTIWLRLNGSDVAGSSGYVSVPSKHGSVVGHTVTSWNYLLSVVAGQYYELMWSTTNHTAVTMEYYPAGSPPPSTASVILTVTQQAGIMAGTGITAINSLTGAAQTLATGTTGTDFGISSSGTTHTFNLPTASATNRGLLSSANWSTFDGKQDALVSGTNIKTVNSTSLLGSGNVSVGTVTSVAALTLGTTGTDLSSSVATGTTTPVITLNVPTASASNRGVLSTADWSKFSSKQDAITLTTTGTTGPATFSGSTLNIPNYTVSVTAKSFMGVLQGTTLAGGATQYGCFNYSTLSATELGRVFVVPYACTASNFYIRIFSSQPANGSFVFTLRKNQVDTAVIATIAAGSAANTEANSGSTSVTFAAGDDMTFSGKNNATTTSGNIHNTSIMIEI